MEEEDADDEEEVEKRMSTAVEENDDDQDEDQPFLGYKTQPMKCEASTKASHRQFDFRSEIFFTPGFALSLDGKGRCGNKPRQVSGFPKMQIETKYI